MNLTPSEIKEILGERALTMTEEEVEQLAEWLEKMSSVLFTSFISTRTKALK